MNVLLLSTSDIEGGAARAAYRLHQGLQGINVNSQMLVQSKSSHDAAVFAPKTNLASNVANSRVTFDALPLKLYPQRHQVPFSPQWVPDSVQSKIARINPEIINLHWVNAGYIRIESLAKLRQPIVWTLHDMWPFTGGCHYNQGCDRYRQTCGACPQLQSHKTNDLSRWIWHRKAKAWRQRKLTIVALSSWLKDCAQSSALFKDLRIELIPNGIDTQVYKPADKRLARELLGLPQDKSIALFGAVKATSDKRKGFHLLQSALQELSRAGWGDRLELAVFGASRPENAPDFGLASHYLGSFQDDLSLSLVYSAADVFVLPSVQDNLPNTVIEALACQVPCIAFKVGGMPDMIEHQRNGFLAQPYEISDLAKGIAWVLENKERHQKLSWSAREKVEQAFTQQRQAQCYASLFSNLLSVS
ncbi:MAG: glycosyltransferase family 4 protein [Leptolyngbya sp. SIO1E4]|nr:glycosyltransferase family 4 protein [Leptolyngbya sp. SIO1E4]